MKHETSLSGPMSSAHSETSQALPVPQEGPCHLFQTRFGGLTAR